MCRNTIGAVATKTRLRMRWRFPMSDAGSYCDGSEGPASANDLIKYDSLCLAVTSIVK